MNYSQTRLIAGCHHHFKPSYVARGLKLSHCWNHLEHRREERPGSGAGFPPAETGLIVSSIDLARAAQCVMFTLPSHPFLTFSIQLNISCRTDASAYRTRTHNPDITHTHTLKCTQQTGVCVCLSAHSVNFTWELSWCVGCGCAWCVCQNREAVWMHWTWSKMACSFLNHPVSLNFPFRQKLRHLLNKPP